MKQFLYLDSDIVNSIIAQSEKGLVQSLAMEEETSESENDSNKTTIDIKATAGGEIAKLAKAEANLSGSFEFADGGYLTSTSREIISKTLHDAAFDIAYNHVSPMKVEIEDRNEPDTGSYVEMVRVFSFVDLEYLERLFDKGSIIEYLKKSEAEQIKEALSAAINHLNREQKRQVGNKANSATTSEINKNNQKYDEVHTIIKALRSLIPYNRMLISSDGYLIPLNEKYFRVDPRDLGFKYGGEITCVGMLTNIIGVDTDPEDKKNIFATIQFAANEALRMILPTKKSNLCIIHPIAIYYGV